MNTSIFICQLSQQKQNKIKTKVKKYLVKNNYDSNSIKEIIDNVMCDRLCLLEEFMSVKEFLV